MSEFRRVDRGPNVIGPIAVALALGGMIVIAMLVQAAATAGRPIATPPRAAAASATPRTSATPRPSATPGPQRCARRIRGTQRGAVRRAVGSAQHRADVGPDAPAGPRPAPDRGAVRDEPLRRRGLHVADRRDLLDRGLDADDAQHHGRGLGPPERDAAPVPHDGARAVTTAARRPGRRARGLGRRPQRTRASGPTRSASSRRSSRPRRPSRARSGSRAARSAC